MFSKVAMYIFGIGLAYYALRKNDWDPVNAIAYASFWVSLWGLSFEFFFKKYGKDIASPAKGNDSSPWLDCGDD